MRPLANEEKWQDEIRDTILLVPDNAPRSREITVRSFLPPGDQGLELRPLSRIFPSHQRFLAREERASLKSAIRGSQEQRTKVLTICPASRFPSRNFRNPRERLHLSRTRSDKSLRKIRVSWGFILYAISFCATADTEGTGTRLTLARVSLAVLSSEH